MPQIPARKLIDISLEEAAYKPDFEITERFQRFASELSRLSLLGLGLYGLLLAHGAESKGSVSATLLDATLSHKTALASSLFLFGLGALFALGNSFYATRCLNLQLAIVRFLHRLDLDHWSTEEKVAIRKMIEEKQADQKSILTIGFRCLLTATVSLALGAMVVACVFAAALFQVR
jgi:hypothetical protein